MGVQPVSGTILDRIQLWFNRTLQNVGVASRVNFTTDFGVAIDTNNNFFDISLASPLPSSKLPASVVQNNQNNSMGAFYEDRTQIAAPANPAAGTVRLYVDSSNGFFTALTSAGVKIPLTPSGGGANAVLNNQNNNFGAFYEDLQAITAPASPTVNTIRLYVDSATGHLTLKNNSGTTFDLQAAANPNLVLNNQNNSLGAFYEELTQIAKPANPAAGTRRIYVDSGTGALSSLDSAGTSHNLETAAAIPVVTNGKATFSGNGSLRTFNIAHSIGAIPTSISVTPGSLDASKGYYTNTGSSDNEGANVWYTADATNITVNYNTSVSAPASGTNNLVYWWVAYA